MPLTRLAAAEVSKYLPAFARGGMQVAHDEDIDSQGQSLYSCQYLAFTCFPRLRPRSYFPGLKLPQIKPLPYNV